VISRLHHNAYRCRDSEQTRAFYEGFLGLPLAGTLEDQGDQERARDEYAAHLLPPRRRFLPGLLRGARHALRIKSQHDYDCISRSRSAGRTWRRCSQGRAEGIETRGVSDHGFIDSIYFRDPNGYVIELCTKREGHDRAMDPATNGAREKLQRWTMARRATAAA